MLSNSLQARVFDTFRNKRRQALPYGTKRALHRRGRYLKIAAEFMFTSFFLAQTRYSDQAGRSALSS
jgi:hypothetical protein